MHPERIVVAAAMVLLAACEPSTSVVQPTPSPALATATLAATIESPPMRAFETPASTPTLALTTGRAITQVNVRQEPMAASRVIGMLGAGEVVQIVGQDPGGHWYQILFAGGDGGMAWLAAQFIQVSDTAVVPALGGGGLATVREQINVRNGPGTQFDALGLLKPSDVVTLTGKDSAGIWIQIAYQGGSEGHGWVAAAFVDSGGTDSLPVVASSGASAGTITPTAAVTPPKTARASEDVDSLDAPATSAKFGPSGVSSIFYSSDISWPQGDRADWIGFTPYYDAVTVTLDCHGAHGLSAELLSEGSVVAGVPVLSCGVTQRIRLRGGQPYVLHVHGSADNSQSGYAIYTASIFEAAAQE